MSMASSSLLPLLPTKTLNHPRLLPLPCKAPTAAPRPLLISFHPPAATRRRRRLRAAAQEPAAGYQYDDGEEYEDEEEEEYCGDEDEGGWQVEEMDVEAMELEARGAAADLTASLARELRIGEKLVSPGAKVGLIPLVVPLSESPAGNLTSLLRWPTAPRGMEMPVVEVRNHGLWLLAKNVNEYIHRILVEADISAESSDDLWSAAGEAGKSLYTKGDFKESQMADLDVYLLKKVGLYPDVIERKTSRHLEKGDNVSALITGEFYTREQFPGFGRPFVFNAEILRRVGRTSEARDSARVALKSPWWTLGCRYEEAAELAGWEDEQIEFIREKVTEEGKLEDLKKGKAPEQVVLDEAAFLMDLAFVDGNWDDVVDRIAECYREAGLHDIARNGVRKLKMA